jgi:hypothetical protein
MPRLAWALAAVVLLAAANLAVQVARKPTELLGLAFAPAPLAPAETWARYGPLLRRHSTALIRPALLGALVQLESAGDPLARTYWRWRPSWNPFRLYAPASSAVGILQITDGTFEEARHLCVHAHRAVRDDGPVGDRCWLNGLYFRTFPGDSIEMTSAFLDRSVARALEHLPAAWPPPGPARTDALAAAIHLCGPARGVAFASRGLRPAAGERCGDHDLQAYLARLRELVTLFERMDGSLAGAADGARRTVPRARHSRRSSPRRSESLTSPPTTHRSRNSPSPANPSASSARTEAAFLGSTSASTRRSPSGPKAQSRTAVSASRR